MKVYTKSHNGDAVKAYRVLTRKLSKEGFYQELKDRESFKTKGQRRREKLKAAKSREKRRVAKLELVLAKQDQNSYMASKSRAPK